MLKAVESRPSDPPAKLSPEEWLILRASVQLGPGASTAEIVRQVVDQGAVRDFRSMLVILRRLADKGYVTVEQEGPRREVWNPIVSIEEAMTKEMRRIVREIVGKDRRSLWMMRKVIPELEAEAGDGVSGSGSGES